jgi:hypothetical protein
MPARLRSFLRHSHTTTILRNRNNWTDVCTQRAFFFLSAENRANAGPPRAICKFRLKVADAHHKPHLSWNDPLKTSATTIWGHLTTVVSPIVEIIICMISRRKKDYFFFRSPLFYKAHTPSHYFSSQKGREGRKEDTHASKRCKRHTFVYC